MSSGIHIPKGTYRKANLALGLSAAGLVAAFPFQHVFWGGLVTSGCSAALVGGLADWFAVNALFRRPLGVKPGKIFRTEIIPRNRERIYQALSDMVQNELLSQEALKNKLSVYDFSSPVLKIWEGGGRNRLDEPLTEFIQVFLPSLHGVIEDLDEEFAEVRGDGDSKKDLYPLLGKILERLIKSGEGEKVAKTVLENVSIWAESSEVHHWLSRWIEFSITRYVDENPSRKFLTMFLPEPSVLSTRLQEELTVYLRNEEALEGILSWAKGKVREFDTLDLGPYKATSQNQTPLDKAIQRLLEMAQQALPNFLNQKIEAPESALQLSQFLLNQIERWTIKLEGNSEERLKFNAQVLGLLYPMIENQHERIGKIVQEGLERYSDEMLVELIESKAGEDLQMIRINGSVVGGLVGMLIFVLNSLLV